MASWSSAWTSSRRAWDCSCDFMPFLCSSSGGILSLIPSRNLRFVFRSQLKWSFVFNARLFTVRTRWTKGVSTTLLLHKPQSHPKSFPIKALHKHKRDLPTWCHRTKDAWTFYYSMVCIFILTPQQFKCVGGYTCIVGSSIEFWLAQCFALCCNMSFPCVARNSSGDEVGFSFPWKKNLVPRFANWCCWDSPVLGARSIPIESKHAALFQAGVISLTRGAMVTTPLQ